MLLGLTKLHLRARVYALHAQQAFSPLHSLCHLVQFVQQAPTAQVPALQLVLFAAQVPTIALLLESAPVLCALQAILPQLSQRHLVQSVRQAPTVQVWVPRFVFFAVLVPTIALQ